MAVPASGHLVPYCACGTSVCIGAADPSGRGHQRALADQWRRDHAIGHGEHEEVDVAEWCWRHPGETDAAGRGAPSGKDE